MGHIIMEEKMDVKQPVTTPRSKFTSVWFVCINSILFLVLSLSTYILIRQHGLKFDLALKLSLIYFDFGVGVSEECCC